MIFIPGFLISLLTFPGVIVHEMAHRFFADRAGVPVYKVCYFRLGNPAGYVVHGSVQNLKSSLLISVGPLILNTLLCAALSFPAILAIFHSGSSINPAFLLQAWLGFSIGMHAFPSNEDFSNLVRQVKTQRGGGIWFWLAKFFAMLFKIANALRFFWFDLIYALGISWFLPWVLGLV